ncbi:MAG: acetyltransferase [Candidatus Margulisiibacteriota bacterium]|jgi:sugar O-acyltransferase (sialic acid O-acetyltransferase NeuD family)
MAKEKLVLIGGGGHCKSCIDVIESEGKYEIVGIVDQKENINNNVLGYKIFATDQDFSQLAKEYKFFLITIGQIKTIAPRKKIFELLNNLQVAFPVIISPYAVVSRHATIDNGSIIMHKAVVNFNAKIGKNCIVNTGAIVEHDAVIKDFCHISTGSIINGGTIVNQGTFIGSNTVVREYIEIGSNVIISAGLRIMNSINDNIIIKNQI